MYIYIYMYTSKLCILSLCNSFMWVYIYIYMYVHSYMYRCVLQCVAVCCSVLQCVACCSVLQCVAVCCSIYIYHIYMSYRGSIWIYKKRCWRHTELEHRISRRERGRLNASLSGSASKGDKKRWIRLRSATHSWNHPKSCTQRRVALKRDCVAVI